MRLLLGACLLFLAGATVTAPELTLLAYLGGSGTDDCDGIGGRVYFEATARRPP